jgi:4-amino-4-deoxy-L-arabinose transferase-like glycosyltransferase
MSASGSPWHVVPLMIGAWLLLLIVALLSRHIMPVDETRYLSVAWEMWQRGDMLVPHLNGEPYHHKPPLLFWLINLVWMLFGVSEAAARVVPAAAGLAGALLTIPLAARLWPREPGNGTLAAWLTFTAILWTLWTTAVMFDLLIAVCAEIALLGVLEAWRGRQVTGWLIAGLGIGLGILAKGPVILVYVLPVAVLAPLWMTEQRPRSWGGWYGGLAGALALGAAIGLAWALTAAAAGGESYANNLLWGQTTGRVVESFAHRRPFWWYLPLLPVALFPWSLWSPLWGAVRRRFRARWDSGERLTLVLAVSGLLIFSAISGKQLHYLLPLFPALALFAARAMTAAGPLPVPGPWAIWLPVTPLLVLGTSLFVLPYVTAVHDEAAWVDQISPLAAAPILAVLILAVAVARRVPVAIWPGIVSLSFVLALYPVALREVANHYDVTDIASLIGEQQAAGRPVAYVGKSHGEFNFPGRLKVAVEPVDADSVAAWVAANPDGWIVERTDQPPVPDAPGVRYWRPYRSSYLLMRDARSWERQYEGIGRAD